MIGQKKEGPSRKGSTKKCYYCGKDTAIRSTGASITMYNNVKQGYYDNQLEFNVTHVLIHRCAKCRKIHNFKKRFPIFTAIVGIIVGCMIVIFIRSFWAFLLGGLAGWITGYVFGLFVGCQVRGDVKKLYDHPEIKALQSKGWCIGKKPARTH